MDDQAELCCAAGICCNAEKRETELAELLTKWCGHHLTPEAVAAAIHDHFDLAPKSLGFGPAFRALADMAIAHGPYQ